MRSIFKLYIFKLVILSLTMIFISFGANAYSIKVMYGYCKPLQNNGFNFENMEQGAQIKALTCYSYMTAVKDFGYANCGTLSVAKRNGAEGQSGTFDTFNLVKDYMASGKADADAVIASFIKFAENNPDKWKYKSTEYVKEYLSDVFPCKLDK